MNLKVVTKSLIISVILTVTGLFCLSALHPELFRQGAMNMFFSVDAVLLFVLLFIAAFAGAFISSAGADAPSLLNAAEDSERESGTVKWFNASKGFGFITRDDGTDVFVHYRSIRGEGRRVLYEGQKVRFDTSEGDKGLQADDVEIMSKR